MYVLVAALCLTPIPQSQGKITSQYGWRQLPGDTHRTFHGGIDIAAKLGTPVRAIQDGVVTFAHVDMRGTGGKVINITTQMEVGEQVVRYGHLHQILVQRKATVKRGQIIGLVGSTGFSTGPHLHLEVMTVLPDDTIAFHNPIAWICNYRRELHVPHFRSPGKREIRSPSSGESENANTRQ